MLVGPMLFHRMALVSVRLFSKNLGNLQEFFGQMVYRPPWQKIARTPMRLATQLSRFILWHNGRRARQPALMYAPGVASIFQRKI